MSKTITRVKAIPVKGGREVLMVGDRIRGKTLTGPLLPGEQAKILNLWRVVVVAQNGYTIESYRADAEIIASPKSPGATGSRVTIFSTGALRGDPPRTFDDFVRMALGKQAG